MASAHSLLVPSLTRAVSTTIPALPSANVLRAPWATAALGRMNLRDWQDVARDALTPDFARQLGFSVDFEIGILGRNADLLQPNFSEAALKPLPAAVTFQFAQRQGASLAQVTWQRPGRLLSQGLGGFEFERSVFASGFRRTLSDGSSIDVAAVFAQQGYATPGFGEVTASSVQGFPQQQGLLNQNPALGASGITQTGFNQGEQSSGAGLRLGFSSEVRDGLSVGASFQSRIDMDPFQNYRGVYAEPGDFDIPASANFGMLLRASDRAAITFDVQRVLYSDVRTFTTALLPDRFLSLLGDSASPNFAWDDLTVFELGWNWEPSDDTTWKVSVSTSQQPEPDSPTLARALRQDVPDRSIALGFTTSTGRNARLNLNASYAPAEYYLGNPQFAQPTDLTGDSFEVELLWVWDF